LRTFYAFDSRRSAILLIGGEKTGDDRWYEKIVPLADRIFGRHLEELRKEEKDTMPTRKFRELIEAMPPDRQRRIEKRFQDSLVAMPLDQLRKAQEMTQLELAGILGVNQGEVSKIEHRSDICVSTLADYVEALGGRLEIRAVFKDREIRITQFEKLAS
jgi:DNA-binding XRE family transcriptional regulator